MKIPGTRFLPVIISMLAAGAAVAGTGYTLPTDFRHARIVVQPRTIDGETITFYTDTGGGFNAINEQVAERLGLEIETVTIGEFETRVTDYPGFQEGEKIPVGQAFMDGRLRVVETNFKDSDGFLGGRWFAGKTWEIDYPAETLRLLQNWKAPRDGRHAVALGFQVNAAGERTMHFARMPVVIDGESIDMLLDTGANGALSENAAGVFDLPAGTSVATSFIIESTFEKWSRRHPDWRVIEAAESGTGFPMIRVPEVTIAGHTVGPVWFTQRHDRSFHEYMAQYMDKPIDGAIGGSAFQYFRMVVDYPNAKAYFFVE